MTSDHLGLLLARAPSLHISYFSVINFLSSDPLPLLRFLVELGPALYGTLSLEKKKKVSFSTSLTLHLLIPVGENKTATTIFRAKFETSFILLGCTREPLLSRVRESSAESIFPGTIKE